MNLLPVNVGGLDRILRVVIGLAAITWGISVGSWWGALGIIPLATAAMSTCPVYTLLGMNSCPAKTDA